MKKNEYVSPEMEIVEITEQCNIMAISGGDVSGELDPDNEMPGRGGKSRNSFLED